MKQSHTFLNVAPDRAKVRHQHTRRRLSAVSTKQLKRPNIQRRLSETAAYPTPASLGEDVGEESDAEDVPQCHTPSTIPDDDSKSHYVKSPRSNAVSPRLYNETHARKESIHDLFSATRNIDAPYYVQAYQTRQPEVSRVLNYYLQVAGPTAIWRPQLVDGDPNAFTRSFFQLSMQEPVMFEAVVSISQAHLDLSQSPGSQPSTAVLQHRGKVLRMLHASLLSSPDPKVKDTDLMAVFCMLVLDIMYLDWDSVKANMQGFRRMASLRGGIDNLGWQGWFRTCFSWAELRWAGHIARASSTTKSNVGLEYPTYPTHPFNPATCLSISKLPEGLREAALSLQLSNEVITFLSSVQSWSTGPHPTCVETWTRQPLASFSRSRDDYLRSLRISMAGADILGKYILKPSERLLCIGVIAYIISADGSVDDGRQPRGLEDHMVGIKAVCTEVEMCEHLLWAGLAVACSTDGVMAPLSNHWVLLDRVMELDTRDEFREWKNLKTMVRKYFWNPFIEAKWERCWEAAVERKFDRNRSRWMRPPDAKHRDDKATRNITDYTTQLWPDSPPNDLVAAASNGNGTK